MEIVQRKKKALTFVEVMVVVLIIAVAVLGAMGFRFYCVKDAKRADVQVNAARIGSMILENWKGMGGKTDYNPKTQFGLFTSQFTVDPDQQVGASNTYQIQDLANQVWYDATLQHTSGTPNKLNVSIVWYRNYAQSGDVAHTISMTTYAD